VAVVVETKRRVPPAAPELLGTREDRPEAPTASSQAVQERLLALITPEPKSQRVVRRAARSAQRLDGELDLLYVRPYGREPSATERVQLESLRRLAAVLGCHLLIEEGDDVAEVAARVARERGTTYVLMGVPGGRRGLRRFSEPLHDRLLKLLPGVDLRIVADRER
jgi:two-component system sensor histidine kinase KdpD